MRATLDSAAPGSTAEQRAIAALFRNDSADDDSAANDSADDDLTGVDPGAYLGANDLLIDAALDRARRWRAS